MMMMIHDEFLIQLSPIFDHHLFHDEDRVRTRKRFVDDGPEVVAKSTQGPTTGTNLSQVATGE